MLSRMLCGTTSPVPVIRDYKKGSACFKPDLFQLTEDKARAQIPRDLISQPLPY